MVPIYLRGSVISFIGLSAWALGVWGVGLEGFASVPAEYDPIIGYLAFFWLDLRTLTF